MWFAKARGVALALVFATPLSGFAGPSPKVASVASLFTTLTPATPDANDGVPYELGTVFQASVDGVIDQIIFYKSSRETGTHVGHIWSSDGSVLLATVAFTKETASGWQQATLAHPVRVAGGQTYVVSSSSNGHFADTVGGLAAPGIVRDWIASFIDAAGLHAKGLKVVAGMGGMSWGFDQIIAANPDIACPGNPLVANPVVPKSWDYQYRIIDYLFSFGVDGVAVQSGDEGRCDIAALSSLDNVDYHARIVDRVATYIRGKYPGAAVKNACHRTSSS